MTTRVMPMEMPEPLRSRLSEFVADRLGLHFPAERWGDLERGVRKAAQESGSAAIEPYVEQVLASTSDSPILGVLANHLTVGETYFFREPRSFALFEERIIEFSGTRHENRRPLRIWSAGCATGEEPYSVAILLLKLIPDLKDGDISILATDVNSRSIERAAKGVYGAWSFRNTPAWVRSAYFTAVSDGQWAINPAVKSMVRFARVNLVAGDRPAPFESPDAFDVILCRNVLMYCTPEAARKIIRRLFKALRPGGWLIVGSAEASQILFREFPTVGFPGTAVYRKPAEMNAIASVDPARPDRAAGFPQHGLALAQDQEPETAGPGSCPDNANQSNCADRSVLLLARGLADQGKLQEALRLCDRVIRIDKMDAHAHYLRAAILQEQGFWKDAILSLRRAIYANPEFVLAHVALGSVAKRQERPTPSRKHFEISLELLRKYQDEDVLPGSAGLTAARLRDWVCLEIDQASAMEIEQTTGSPAQREASKPPGEVAVA